jgi:ribonuclease BN (tRNA processing enzyme)
MLCGVRLIVLGSGTCVPSLRRNAPGYLLLAGGSRLLIDCGSGTLLQLERVGQSYREIDAVCITHTHPDHVADLVPLLHALRATPGYVRTRKLPILGPPSVRALLERAYPRLLSGAAFAVPCIEMPGAVELGSVQMSACRTPHTDDSVAYRIEEQNGSVVLTGDTDYDEGLVAFARGADLLVADCSFPDQLKAAAHMSSSDCGRLAREARVGRLLLSHLYPTELPEALRLSECRAIFGGPVQLAEDLIEIEI